jgi:PAS domain S-box-containing protein
LVLIGRREIYEGGKTNHRTNKETIMNSRYIKTIGVSLGLGLAAGFALFRCHRALRHSEHRFRRLFEKARDGILLVDPESRLILEANPFLADLLGYTREEILGKELWQIGLPRDKVASREAFHKLQTEGFICYDNLPAQTKNGERREVEFISNLYRENGNEVLQCHIRDITERQQMEELLRQSGERIRLLAESMPERIWSARPDGSVDFLSDSWSDYTGLSLQDIQEWHWTKIIHPESLEKFVRSWKEA